MMIEKTNFIKNIIDADIEKGKNQGQIITRFPPEPNGYLHIGHAKSICLNFSIAKEYGGVCHLRMDDTNPMKEEQEYVEAIKENVRWLGYDWGEHLYYASDYYDKLYGYAIELIKNGKAYVDSLSAEQIREYRGTLQEPGKNSPYRDRSVEENLKLFKRMRAGEFAEGDHVLRAKIDMGSGNLNMRDPVLYRIRHAHHQRTGNKWCIYPMYDFAHSLSDAIEGITHSLCTLEFQDHRPLYDWCVDNVSVTAKPQQIEFARLNFTHTITSKRKLKELVESGYVSGWDDPRMSTLVGIKRRGFPPAAIRKFCDRIGVSKSDSVIDMSILEECVRDELNVTAKRAMCVLEPLKIVIENYPDAKEEVIQAANHPQNEALGTRELYFTKELYIEREDFLENPPKKFFRLSQGKEVRLRNAYVIKCEQVIKDAKGNITELKCSYDPNTLGKNPEGRKVKGVIHWVSAKYAKKAEVRLYDRLFKTEKPGTENYFTDDINPNSLTIMSDTLLEPSLANVKVGNVFQFERQGYFCVDKESNKQQLIFNRVVTLRDSWKAI